MADVERIQTVNLSQAYDYTRTKRSRRAVDILREFIGSATKAGDVVLSNSVNSTIWTRGNQKPPRKIKVRILIDGEVARVYLPDEKIEEKKKEKEQKTEDKKSETKPIDKEEKQDKKLVKEQKKEEPKKEDKKEDKK